MQDWKQEHKKPNGHMGEKRKMAHGKHANSQKGKKAGDGKPKRQVINKTRLLRTK